MKMKKLFASLAFLTIGLSSCGKAPAGHTHAPNEYGFCTGCNTYIGNEKVFENDVLRVDIGTPKVGEKYYCRISGLNSNYSVYLTDWFDLVISMEFKAYKKDAEGMKSYSILTEPNRDPVMLGEDGYLYVVITPQNDKTISYFELTREVLPDVG